MCEPSLLLTGTRVNISMITGRDHQTFNWIIIHIYGGYKENF